MNLSNPETRNAFEKFGYDLESEKTSIPSEQTDYYKKLRAYIDEKRWVVRGQVQRVDDGQLIQLDRDYHVAISPIRVIEREGRDVLIRTGVIVDYGEVMVTDRGRFFPEHSA